MIQERKFINYCSKYDFTYSYCKINNGDETWKINLKLYSSDRLVYTYDRDAMESLESDIDEIVYESVLWFIGGLEHNK